MPSRKKRPASRPATRPYKPAPGSPTFQLPADVDPANLRYLSYDITYEPFPNNPAEWPDEIADQTTELFQLVNQDPKAAIPRLEALCQQYPNAPRLFNYLMNAHGQAGHNDIARQMAEESYRRFPDYLFGKLTWVNILLDENKLDEAAAILDNKFDLTLLYPDRTKFHITEYLSFAMTIGWFFAKKGDLDVAQRYYEIMAEMEPDAPQTRALGSRIQLAVLSKGFQRLSSLSKKKRRK